jgi:hypothetical protein
MLFVSRAVGDRPGHDQPGDNVDADRPLSAGTAQRHKLERHMPTCPSCHVAAIAVAHSALAVRDLGVAGAVSIAAASAVGIGYRRGMFDAPVARSAASDADGDQTRRIMIEIPTAVS